MGGAKNNSSFCRPGYRMNTTPAHAKNALMANRNRVALVKSRFITDRDEESDYRKTRCAGNAAVNSVPVTAPPLNPRILDPATRSHRRVQYGHAALALLAICIFAAFTWRSPLMFFSGDDMMNMYKAWQTPVRELLVSLAAFWEPAYRPLGGAVYRFCYGVFGFHPRPLYVFSWAVLIAKTRLLDILVARITRTAFHPRLTCVIASVHGMYLDLYYSAGTIYDHLSAFFCLLALNVWIGMRLRSGKSAALLSCAAVVLTIAGCDSKENAVALPLLLLAGELLLAPRSAGVRPRLRWLVPVALSTVVVAIFIAGRIAGTADLNSNPAYRPRL